MKFKNEKKIVIVNLSNTSSCGLYALNLTENILKRYKNVKYIGSKNSIYQLQASSLKCQTIFIETYKNKCQFIFRSIFILPLLAIRIFLNKNSIYIFPLHHFWNLLIMLLLKIKRSEIVMAVHDDKMHAGLYNYFEDIVTSWQIKLATKHVFLTAYVRDSLNKRLHIHRKNEIIPLGVYDYESLKKSVRDITHKSSINLLFFGLIAKYKGVDVLIDAFYELEQTYDNIYLKVVGKHQEINLINEKVKTCKRVTIVNRFIPNDEVSLYFNEADIVILPYLEASQSGVLSITRQCFIPTVVTNVGGLPEMVSDNNTGIVCKPNSEELYLAIQKLLNDKQLYKKISVNIKNEVEKNSWQNIADKWLSFIFKSNK